MPKKGKDRSKPLPRGMEHMQGNVPLNGVRGWQRKKVAVPHAEHWPYGTLDFSQNPAGQYSSVPSNHVAAPLPQEFLPPPNSTWQSPMGAPRAELQARLHALPTSSIRDGRVARPRQWGNGRRIRRIASPPTRTFNDTPSSHPPSDATGIPKMAHQYTTSTEDPYARTSGLLNRPDYVLPSEVNTDTVPRSTVTGAFESRYMTAHPSIFFLQDADHQFVESSMGTYPTPPNNISNSHVLSTNSPVGARHRDWQSACDTRTRVGSQSSIAYAIPVDPSGGIRQDTVSASKLPLRVAKNRHSPRQHSCTSSTSSSLDSFFSTAVSYAPSERITHLELEAGLQIQQYSGTTDFPHSSSVVNPFPPYTLPDDMVAVGELYHPAAHHK